MAFPQEWKPLFFIIQLLSHVQLFVTSWIAACQASMSFTLRWSLLKFVSIESAMPSNYLILCYPLLLLSSIFPSIWVFFSFFFLNEMTICIRWYIKAYIEWFLFSWTMNELLLSPDKQEFKNWNLWFYQIYKHFSITFVQINKLFVYWDHCAFLIFPWYLSQAVWLGLEVLMP